jgi:hypothetical protein
MKTKSINMAWFDADEWPKLLAIAADRDNLPDTYEEFAATAGKRFDRLIAQGVQVRKTLISVAELTAAAAQCGKPVDSNFRAFFAAFIAARRARAH